jgi:hypothetical protein
VHDLPPIVTLTRLARNQLTSDDIHLQVCTANQPHQVSDVKRGEDERMNNVKD